MHTCFRHLVLCLLLLSAGTVHAIDQDEDGVPHLWDLDESNNSVRMFADVAEAYWASRAIEALGFSGISLGCGNSNYCPGAGVTRAQMAVFLLRAIEGFDYVPPHVAASRFSDVPASHWALAWIERLAEVGITRGCGIDSFCPEQIITRAQMAVFLLRAKHGVEYSPDEASQSLFLDVGTDHWAGAWINQLAVEGVTSGCQVNLYCPAANVNRAQMAVFLQRTFNLPEAFISPRLALDVVSEDGGNLSVFQGAPNTARVQLVKLDQEIEASLYLQGNTDGLELIDTDEGVILAIDGAALPAGESSRSVRVVAEDIEHSTYAYEDLSIHVLEPELVASGRIDASGGAVLSDGGAIGLQIDPGELGSSLGIDIYAAQSAGGGTLVQLVFDRDFSDEDVDVTLFSNQTALDSKGEARVLSRSEEHSYVGNVLAEYQAFFRGGKRVARRTVSAQELFRECVRSTTGPWQDAYACQVMREVASRVSYSDRAATPDPHEAVLFVHGYTRGGGLGGSSGTWGAFPALVESQLSPEGLPLAAYEFRWRTNSSFKTVAWDLAYAINAVYTRTGRPVRIVAHSFGGLLVRTLLQGLALDDIAEQSAFDNRMVHSVMTVGTPHSGIFPDETIGILHGRTFPDGQDNWAHNLCGQISCREAGETVLIDLDETVGGLVMDLAETGLPADIPFTVALGLQRTDDGDDYSYAAGDSLITFDGQRIHPQLASKEVEDGLEVPGFQVCGETDLYGKVTEVFLGPLDEATGLTAGNPHPGSAVAAGARGYAHNAPVREQKAVYTSRPEADLLEVNIAETEFESHATADVFRHFIGSADLDPYCSNDRVIEPAPSSMIGFDVTYLIHFPEKGELATVPFIATISNESEIRGGEIQLLGNFSNRLIRADVDFRADSVVVNYIDGGLAIDVDFNGAIYEFSEDSPIILDAYLQAGGSFNPQEIVVEHSQHTVWVNLSGVNFEVGDSFTVQLELEGSQ